MLTVVVVLAFISMSEALSRQGYLVVPEKAEMADPAYAPRLAVCACVCACVCVFHMLNGFMLLHICICYKMSNVYDRPR